MFLSSRTVLSYTAHSFVFAASVVQGGLFPRTRAASYPQRGFGLGENIIAKTARSLQYYGSQIWIAALRLI